MHRRRVLQLLAGSAAMATGLHPGSARPAVGQSASDWREPAVIFSTTGYLSHPRLVVDPSGDVHVMIYHSSRDDDSAASELVYTRQRDGVWSTPIDVLVSRDGAPAGAPSMALDSGGFLHALWPGGGIGAHYSRAHVAEAGSARGWTKPEILRYEGILNPTIAIGPDDIIHVAFPTLLGQLVYRRSIDGGENWSDDVTIAEEAGERKGVGIDFPFLAADAQGIVHLVWGDYGYPGGWPPLGVWHVRSLDRGASWQEPLMIDRGLYAQIGVAVDRAGAAHVLWHGTASGTHDRKYRRSVDGGLSWGTAEQVVPTLWGGLTGTTRIAFDSAGIPHAATSVDTTPFPGTVGAVYHIRRDAERWSSPVPISRNARGLRSVEHPSIAIGLGNQLHVIWEDDFQRTMYTTRTVDAPPIAGRAVPPPPPRRSMSGPPALAAHQGGPDMLRRAVGLHAY